MPHLGVLNVKPVYAPEQGTECTTGLEEFVQWYHDVDGVSSPVEFTFDVTADAQGNIVYQNNAFFLIDERNFINTVTHHRCGKPGDARAMQQPPRCMTASPRAAMTKTDADPKNRADCVIRSARCGNSPGPHQRGATWVTPSQLVQRRRTPPPSFIYRAVVITGIATA